ncbi:MAG: hypothetical protein KDD37_03325, partial [Bdellovibrionales bacterium]|nr:hypothetical protein [Bdellovibrionales bacterium]
LQSSDSPKLEVEKSSLVACHTYQIQTSYMDCDGEVTLNVDYTLDGDSCTTPTPTPTPTPPLYPPPDPAPPGQQTVGMGCSNGYGNNANFDYAHGRYCAADSNSTNELMSCRNGGFDFSSSNIKYYPLIKPGKYLAIEVELPHPFTNGINKTVCGLHVAGEIGNSCGGSGGGAIESWTISTSPGDFNVADPRCATFSTTSSLTGRVLTSPEISGCPMDRGRKYYVNIKMGDNCTAPGGCSFLLQISGLFSGSTYNIGGQPRTLDTSCQFAP